MESKVQPKQLGIFDTMEHQLAEQRMIHLTGLILPPMYHEMSCRLRYLAKQNKKPINIYLNTPGGSLLDALAMYDVIQEINKQVPVNVIAAGCCMSAGVLVEQAGAKRLSYPNAQFMVHELSGNSGGKLSDTLDAAQYAERLQSVIDGIIASRSGIPIEKLRALYRRRDFFLSAKDAKKLHLIDSIIKP